MIVSYAHSRAALLCFGGWGLQVMMHLLPRLQAAQEQRAALSANPADLSRLTSFGAVLAEPLIDQTQRAQFYLRQPLPNQPLPPFYIERTLSRLERELPRAFDEQTGGVLTAAEKHATLLFQSIEETLQPLEVPGRPFHLPVAGLTPTATTSQGAPSQEKTARLRRATRQDMFQAALAHTVPIARLLETHLLDPIRQDDLVADDPFVQTTLYVIAPLFEPLTAALIWPLVAQFMERVGQRHVAQVIAFFATGSYATDLTRPVEDATAFATLAELEALTGLQRHPDQQITAGLAQAIHTHAPHLADALGRPLFDHIYLLDREKSNQGLAQSSHELAVITANALEALIVAGGNLFVQEQLGVGMHTGEGRAYSLIGAAGDYVPLAQVLHAVNRQEESRLVREWVLRNSDQAANPQGATTTEATDDANAFTSLDLTPQQVVAQLAPHLSDLLTNSSPTMIEELRVAESFVVPRATAQQLRRVRSEQWKETFQAHYRELDEYLQLAVGPTFLNESWGIQAVEAGREWFLYEVDDRLVPAAVSRMQRKLLEILAASPAGLTRAQMQTERWLYEIDQQRQRLQTVATPNARHLARVQRLLALRNWEISYLQVSSTAPELISVLGRAGAVIGLAGVVILIYLFLVQRSWSDQDTLGLVSFAVGILLAGLVTYQVKQRRVRALRRERVALAQAALTTQLQEAVSDGLVRVYNRLTELLNHWNRMLAEATAELSTLSTPPTIPAAPPPGVPLMPIYHPHLNEQLWKRCMAYLRTQLDTQGQRSEERLERMWGTPKWFNDMRRILSSSASGKGLSQARTIAQFIRDTVRESVAPVNIEQTNPVRAELVRGLAKEFSIEHLLWRGALEEQEFNRRLRMLELGLLPVTPTEKSEGAPVRRYVEHVWHRAKPTANYEVSNRLAVYGMTVEFVAAPGDAGSELTRTLLDDFNMTLLPTNNPFTILFVRSLHGLALGDLESMRRYQTELSYLSKAEQKLVLINDFFTDSVYQHELYPSPKKDPRAARFASPIGP
ncbi:MAG: hypothetical protein KF832_18470 [Caldilineaceae bacterium]|nr:hypothetical protein [Caldilineaceae bacterium]